MASTQTEPRNKVASIGLNAASAHGPACWQTIHFEQPEDIGHADSRTPVESGGAKANIALARKFLGVIYRSLKNDWVFEDFPNFVLAS